MTQHDTARAPSRAPWKHPDSRIAFKGGYPTQDAEAELADELLYQRAVQSYLWALPILNMWAMKEGSESTFGNGYNVLPIWKQRLRARTLITTPNSDVIYAMGYLDLKQMARTSLEHSFLAGESLWAQPDAFTRMKAACAAKRPGAKDPSAACLAFLKANERAAQQWELERRFSVFESELP